MTRWEKLFLALGFLGGALSVLFLWGAWWAYLAVRYVEALDRAAGGTP